jgi:hypothetical protein
VSAQVDQAHGVFDAQLLLQLETDLLLTLAMLQMTANIPDSCPGAQAACEAAYMLCCGPMHGVWSEARLAKLPETAYTGPQLALQLLPQQPQQPSPSHDGDQSTQWCLLAPSAPLLTELLPLLTRSCLRQLQQYKEHWQQQRQQQQQQAGFSGQPSELLAPIMMVLLSVTSLLICSVH